MVVCIDGMGWMYFSILLSFKLNFSGCMIFLWIILSYIGVLSVLSFVIISMYIVV